MSNQSITTSDKNSLAESDSSFGLMEQLKRKKATESDAGSIKTDDLARSAEKARGDIENYGMDYLRKLKNEEKAINERVADRDQEMLRLYN